MQLHERLYEQSYRNDDLIKKAQIENENNIKKQCSFTPARDATKAKDA